jgi:hypothetical protein
VSRATSFELLRFEATPVTAGVALVELAGRFRGPAPVRPRLLVEAGGLAGEQAAVQAELGPDAVWTAVFAVPVRAIGDPDATFDLDPGRGPLVALPQPTPAGGEDERLVELARTANELRHRLSEASETAATADRRVAEIAAERDRVATELETARVKLAAAEARVEESHAAALDAREAQAGAEGEADQAKEALARAREEARVAVQAEIDAARADAERARAQVGEAQERAIAAEDEARAARRQLVEARARVESLTRQQRATRQRIATPARRATDEDEEDFRAARLRPDLNSVGGHGEEGHGAPVGEEEAAPGEHAGGEEETAPGEHPGMQEEAAPGEHAGTEEAASREHAGAKEEGVPGEHAGTQEEAAPEEHRGAKEETAPKSEVAAPARDDDTAALEPVAGEAATTARLAPVEGNSRQGLWSDRDERVRVLRPRTPGARRLPATRPLGDETDEEPILEPAAVGARTIRPAETSRHRAVEILTNPRVIVPSIFGLLLLAFVLILAGAGPV